MPNDVIIRDPSFCRSQFIAASIQLIYPLPHPSHHKIKLISCPVTSSFVGCPPCCKSQFIDVLLCGGGWYAGCSPSDMISHCPFGSVPLAFCLWVVLSSHWVDSSSCKGLCHKALLLWYHKPANSKQTNGLPTSPFFLHVVCWSQSRPSDAYMCQQSAPLLVQIMTFRQLGTMPVSKPKMAFH